MKKYNWAIIGPGGIAREMAKALNEVNGEIYGVYGRNSENTKKFAEEFKIKNCYENSDTLFNDKNVDIVYISTPNTFHYEYILKAVQNGKHVLCEKPITINSKQLLEVSEIAKEKGIILAEAMTIFHMPLYKKLREIINSGILGEIKMIQVNFGSSKEFDPSNRFFNKELAGGALLDIGVYAVSFARFFLDSRPNKILSDVKLFETGVDEQSGIIMKTPENQMAVIALTFTAKQPKKGVISGTKGYIEISNYPRADKATMTYTESGKTEEIIEGHTSHALNYEVIDMENYITFKDYEEQFKLSCDVTHILNEVRSQWGLTFGDIEKTDI